jgi:hypothetical protein
LLGEKTWNITFHFPFSNNHPTINHHTQAALLEVPEAITKGSQRANNGWKENHAASPHTALRSAILPPDTWFARSG